MSARRSGLPRWARPAREGRRDQGAAFVEMGATIVLAALIITTVYASGMSSTFNEGVRQMVCVVNGPGCGDRTWVDEDRPEEPEQFEWGSGNSNASDNKNLGMQAAAAEPYNWTDQEWTCLDSLWGSMSNWDPGLVDPTTGARGIVGFNAAQHGSLPSGFDQSASAQISWGLGHIQEQYGSPCTAWRYWQSTGTY
ncbi:hypothetical protein [Nocardiopsis eucommiae]|uniref:aggregation-promoting factor C-terminal-like domain-containing protein n=1 Tax=Nocardiopsis eucommiae TaxID=2831970 RepID=UPI003D742373